MKETHLRPRARLARVLAHLPAHCTAYGATPRMRVDILLNQFAAYAWTGRRIMIRT